MQKLIRPSQRSYRNPLAEESSNCLQPEGCKFLMNRKSWKMFVGDVILDNLSAWFREQPDARPPRVTFSPEPHEESFRYQGISGREWGRESWDSHPKNISVLVGTERSHHLMDQRIWRWILLLLTILYFLFVCVLSHVRLFATPWTVACQAPLWDSPGQNTGVGCHFIPKGSFWPRDWTCISYVDRQILYRWATWRSLVNFRIFLGSETCPQLLYLKWRCHHSYPVQ